MKEAELRYKYGEMICLSWDGGSPGYEFVKGHISDKEKLAKAIMDQTGNDFIDGPDDIEDFKLMYGGWRCTAWSEFDHCLFEYYEPARARFPITQVIFKKKG